MENSKNEIKKILDTYELYEDFSITNDEDIKHVIQHRKKYIPSEKPDAFFKQNNVIYGIEHFQISLYKKLKSGDISKQAKGSQCNREKMREDKDFDLHPSIENLLTALSDNLHSHSGSFEAYRDRLTKDNNCKYRLIIFVEDSSESGYIVRKRETQAINPLLLKQIANIFLEYKDDIWGVIVTTGNEKQKRITGCTLAELESKLGNGELFDANEYAPFEVERRVHVAKEDPTQDSNNITIRLFDRL